MYHFPSPGVVDGLDTIGYVANSNERLMTEVRKIKILNSEGGKEKNEFKRDRQNASLNRWKGKKMYGLREMPETVDKDLGVDQ